MSFIEKLPFFYHGDNNVVSIQNSLENEKVIKNTKVEDTIKQLNIDTATWALDLWEEMLGIKTKTTDLDIRRKNIKARLRGRGVTTRQKIIAITESYTNSEVDLDEFPAEYYFNLCILLNSINEQEFNELYNTLESIKPCHLLSVYKWMIKERYKLGMAMITFDRDIVTVYPQKKAYLSLGNNFLLSTEKGEVILLNEY